MTGISTTTVTPDRGPRYLRGAEVALAALTVATVLGFSRLFDDIGFLPEMLITAGFTHLVTVLGRRRAWSVGLTALVALPGFLLLSAWLHFAAYTSAGLPTPTTYRALQATVTEAVTAFSTSAPPVRPLTGFVLGACIAVFCAVFLADWAAFRLWSVFEAVVPAGTLFVFATLLSAPGPHRVSSSGVFLAALLVFVLVHRAARLESTTGWLAPGTTGPPAPKRRSGGLGAGLALVAAALVIGLVGGDRLPWAHSPAMISDWRGLEGGAGDRMTQSPLVNIRDRLVEQSTTEVFTVESDEPAYWRMTGLDSFDGSIWKSSGTFDAVGEDLPAQLARDTAEKHITQKFTIKNLSALWAPAAFQPIAVTEKSAPLGYRPESATLISREKERDYADGLTYTVVSAVPRFTPQQLSSVKASDNPPDIMDRYTALPDLSSDRTADEALRVTKAAGAKTPYEQAVALEKWFRGPEFRYSTDQRVAGHSLSAIDNFLAEKQGFCEQFAGTFAAMARSLHIPARVAVGFTQGEVDQNNPKLYHVRGQHAHAWPEIYLGKFGWVNLEPTPSRGDPNAQSWTTYPPDQDNSVPGQPSPPQPLEPNRGTTTSLRVNGAAGTAPVAPTAIDPAATTTTTEAAAVVPPGDLQEPAQRVPALEWALAIAFAVLKILGVVAVLALVAGAYLLLLSRLKQARRDRRRATATDPSLRTRVAWAECLEALAVLGLRPRPTETHEEFARRAAPDLGDAGSLLTDLSGDVDFAWFAPDVLDQQSAARAEATAQAIAAAATAHTPPMQQWLDRFDPRPLIEGHEPREQSRTVSM